MSKNAYNFYMKLSPRMFYAFLFLFNSNCIIYMYIFYIQIILSSTIRHVNFPQAFNVLENGGMKLFEI